MNTILEGLNKSLDFIDIVFINTYYILNLEI